MCEILYPTGCGGLLIFTGPRKGLILPDSRSLMLQIGAITRRIWAKAAGLDPARRAGFELDVLLHRPRVGARYTSSPLHVL